MATRRERTMENLGLFTEPTTDVPTLLDMLLKSYKRCCEAYYLQKETLEFPVDGVLKSVVSNYCVIKPISSTSVTCRFPLSMKEKMKSSMHTFISVDGVGIVDRLGKIHEYNIKSAQFTDINMSPGTSKKESALILYRRGLITAGQFAKIIGECKIDGMSILCSEIGYIYYGNIRKA